MKLRDHYKAKKSALWLNLIHDLLPATKTSQNRDENCKKDDTILLYDNILQFLPSLKSYNKAEFTPSSREVVWTNASHGILTQNGKSSRVNNISIEKTDEIFSNYSTALSVTIAIGCCLLVFNLLIFSAVYFQREMKSFEKYSKKLYIENRS